MTVYKYLKITEEWSAFLKDEAEEELGHCQKCDKSLKIGDYRDGLAPYYTENNICKECKEE